MSKHKPIPTRHTENPGASHEQVIVRTSVELTEQVYDIYAKQGIERGMDPEQMMAERLRRCAPQKDVGLYFNDQQRKRLFTAIGRSAGDTEGALQHLENFTAIRIGDVTVELEPRLLKRLASRAGAYRKSTEQLIQEEVVRALKEYTGLY